MTSAPATRARMKLFFIVVNGPCGVFAELYLSFSRREELLVEGRDCSMKFAVYEYDSFWRNEQAFSATC